MVDIVKKSETLDRVNELTAQAMHIRTGYDIEACRADSVMRQGLYNVQDSIVGIIAFLGEKYDKETDPKDALVEDAPRDVPGPEAA